jgi:signal peptidase I
MNIVILFFDFHFFACTTQKTLRQPLGGSRMQRMTDPVMPDSSSSDNSNPVVHATNATAQAIRAALAPRKPADRGLFVSIIVALALAFAIRLFVAAPYVVSGSSMEPNFYDWNYLIVDRLTYRFESPQRGDVIVLDLPQETSRALIKRIIGLPGETVVLSGPNPTVTIINAAHPEGFTLTEPYISSENFGGSSNERYELGPNQYFVLGDNRKVSADSRFWGFLPRQDIVGRVALRLWPLSEVGTLPAEARY